MEARPKKVPLVVPPLGELRRIAEAGLLFFFQLRGPPRRRVDHATLAWLARSMAEDNAGIDSQKFWGLLDRKWAGWEGSEARCMVLLFPGGADQNSWGHSPGTARGNKDNNGGIKRGSKREQEGLKNYKVNRKKKQ